MSFGQDDEKKFEGVIKENRFKNFIRKAYYPSSPFDKAFDTIIIKAENLKTGKLIDFLVSEKGGHFHFKNDFSLNLKDFEIPDVSYIRDIVTSSRWIRLSPNQNKIDSVTNFIHQKINNPKFIKVYVPSTISSKNINSQDKQINNITIYYDFKYLSILRNELNNGLPLHYIKINFNQPFRFNYSIPINGRNFTFRFIRKYKNPSLDYFYKINLEGYYKFTDVPLDDFYNQN
jgi:hypothetical protein